MIEFRNLSFGYRGAENALLRNVNFKVTGEKMVLVCGPTGSGKSTLLKLVNGLAPTFTGGQLSGEILVNNESIAHSKPNQLAKVIGYVNQQPEGAFVADTVADEILFGMEQLGFDRPEMQRRLAEIAQLTGLVKLLDRNLTELSGGEQQTVAIAAALAAGQKILLLDEPTSALDQDSANRVIELLSRLIRETGITVILAEHRIERMLENIDEVLLVDLDGSVQLGTPEEIFRDYRLVPPVVRLGQKLGWKPLLLEVSEAKKKIQAERFVPTVKPRIDESNPGPVALSVEKQTVRYRNYEAVSNFDLVLHQGEVVALMGPNGAGKSSLLFKIWQNNTTFITLVPQRAADLLFLPSMHLEFEESDRFANAEPGTTAKLFTKLSKRVDPMTHPRDLSTGQQLALVLAIQLAKNSAVLFLDEPTGGLDYHAKNELAHWILGLRNEGKSILVASHDLEFIATCADRIVQIESGKNSGQGTPEQLLDHRGSQRTQIAELFEIDGLVSLSQIETSRD